LGQFWANFYNDFGMILEPILRSIFGQFSEILRKKSFGRNLLDGIFWMETFEKETSGRRLSEGIFRKESFGRNLSEGIFWKESFGRNLAEGIFRKESFGKNLFGKNLLDEIFQEKSHEKRFSTSLNNLQPEGIIYTEVVLFLVTCLNDRN
jgi:hypothetical protein